MIIDGTNLSMIRGDTERIIISCTNQDGTPAPLVNGDKVYLTVKISIDEEAKILQKVVDTFTDGNAIVSISPTDTKDLTYGTYMYDIQLNRLNGDVTTIIPPSPFTIMGEITYE